MAGVALNAWQSEGNFMQASTSQSGIDFMGKRAIAMVLSAIFIVLSVAGLSFRGLNYGIDFTGGTLVEVAYTSDVDLNAVRQQLASGGFADAVVQQFGTPRDVLIRLAPRGADKDASADSSELSTKLLQVLNASSENAVELRRVEFVGPQVGDELAEDGALAVLVALIAILIYVALRFEWRFALGSVIALVHDVLFTIGIFSWVQLEFDLPVLAAVLAVIGYSLNDTIVVFDRVRENFRKMRKGTPVSIVNSSLNQTLSRTLVTSLTTLLVLAALFFLGGEIIHGFAFALIIGVIIGTYSSIYVASTSVLLLGVNKADLTPVKKEGAIVDNRP